MGSVIGEIMANRKKVVLVEFDESDAIYVDGKLVVDDSPLSPASVLSAVGIDFEQIRADYNDEGEIPENLSDLKE